VQLHEIFTLTIAAASRLVTGDDDGTARVWEMELHELVGEVAPRNLTDA